MSDENNIAYEALENMRKLESEQRMLRDKIFRMSEKEVIRLRKKLEIATNFVKLVDRYVPKVKTPKDFNKYEAYFFLIKSEAKEALEKMEKAE